MFKEVILGIFGLGATAGVGSAIVLPIVNSASGNYLPAAVQMIEEQKDPEYLGKATHYQMKLKIGQVSTSSPLRCEGQEGRHAYFRFLEEGNKKKFDLVCEHRSDKRDITNNLERIQDNEVTVKCTPQADSEGGIKNYECTITGTKHMSMSTKRGDTSRVTLSWS
ncbi:hypothetical protein MHLP_01115 [Candidatus Mycoplasma haematolamae str. Purdue]|uniref:Uncharacterized protein n=1 Tax=Mycoplasma haematolamae (strain Purdue) TaxID=1212765 RepID=I7BIZ8_MYCHA|nr:hypothetical protein [Candidatus Mycoplasma haematolamae]AFO51803.1 hypothetical protein MHLP_01115 [Candidatus Mycoplasma haematolamae str. Purdue]